MSSVLEKFNEMMNEFMLKMINAFPFEPKLKTYYNAFKISKMYKEQLPIEIFMGGCMDFSDQIKSRNVDFFINRPSFVDKCVRASSFVDDTGLRGKWDETSELTKNSIWDYVQTLYVLGEIYINKDPNLVNKINVIYNNMSISELQRFNDENVKEFSSEFKSKIE